MEDTNTPSEHESTDESQTPDQSPAPEATAPEMIGNTKVLSFKELAGDEKMVYIRMWDQYYRLTLTRGGRLVLTK